MKENPRYRPRVGRLRSSLWARRELQITRGGRRSAHRKAASSSLLEEWPKRFEQSPFAHTVESSNLREGHVEQSPRRRSSAWFALTKRTFAEMSANSRDAPKAVIGRRAKSLDLERYAPS
jgi:hypothetical protein